MESIFKTYLTCRCILLNIWNPSSYGCSKDINFWKQYICWHFIFSQLQMEIPYGKKIKQNSRKQRGKHINTLESNLMIDLLLDWWLTFSSTDDWPSPRLMIDLLLDWSCREDIQIVIDFRLYTQEKSIVYKMK